MVVVHILLLIGLPVLAIFCQRTWNWFSPLLFCYIAGLFIGNSFDLPQSIYKQATEITVILAIPLLLFNAKAKDWLTSKVLLSSFLLACLGTLVGIAIATLYYTRVEQIPEMAAMVSGVYTGGTINMAAIRQAIDAPEALFILLNGSDVIYSGIYFLLLISFGTKLISWFLPADKKQDIQLAPVFDTKLAFKEVAFSLVYGLLALGLSLGIAWLIHDHLDGLTIIISISLLGFIGSFIPAINTLKSNYQTGDFILLIFAVAIGGSTQFEMLLETNSHAFGFVGIVFTSALVLHLLLAKLFRISAEAFIMGSTAAFFGPPFIGPIAGIMGSKHLISPGIAIALLGNVIGTYLGLLVYFLMA